jgi:hypothetical protein
MNEAETKDWAAVPRLLSKNEIEVILKLQPFLNSDLLKTAYVKEFLVDHSLTIRNVNSFSTPLICSFRADGKELDGAIVEFLFFKDSEGRFGELEISRLDLEPLLTKTAPRF